MGENEIIYLKIVKIKIKIKIKNKNKNNELVLFIVGFVTVGLSLINNFRRHNYISCDKWLSCCINHLIKFIDIKTYGEIHSLTMLKLCKIYGRRFLNTIRYS